MHKSSKAYFPGDIRTLLKRVSRTLYLSLNILPEPVRAYMGTGYLLCRFMDIVANALGIPAAEKLKLLELVRGLEKPDNASALLERLRPLASLPAAHSERELLLKFGKVLSIYSSFPREDRALLSGLVRGVSAGEEMGVLAFPPGGPSAFKTAAELELYCGYVGGAPGAFWALIYREAIRCSIRGVSEFPSERGAEMLGAAMEMTNILKNISADLRQGRCYLPQEDLDSRNLKPADLLLPANMERLRDITRKWMCWALDRLDQCEAFVSAIPKAQISLRAAAIWPVYWAMDTLEEAAHSNLLDPAERPRVARRRIYATIAATPPLLFSNTAFARGYRFRRETLIGSLTGGEYEGKAI